ncbi:helix-turn-helix domain-containing protein [Microcoleus sp. Pol12B4]|uniref:helix-turn-helix domain-containing protein n=1 Tax=Microcoleus sp. Pol12B4 TaxID=3055395 RepID=UPI002FD54EF5
MSGIVKIKLRKTEEELKALLRKEKDATRHEKLQVLYWLKTQTVETVLSAAVRLGKHRTTIQRWLSSYRRGGNRRIIIPETSFGKTKNNESRNSREILKGIART